MQNPTVSSQSSTPANAYAPSVPISVYRELAAELQATKAMLDSINTQNQQLTQQNQVLRRELGRVVQVALQLQQVLGPSQSSPPPARDTAKEAAQAEAHRIAEQIRATTAQQVPSTPQPPVPPTPTVSTNSTDALFTEEGQPNSPTPLTQTPKDLSGLWLLVVIVTIVITAFGAGFLFVRPLLQGNR